MVIHTLGGKEVTMTMQPAPRDPYRATIRIGAPCTCDWHVDTGCRVRRRQQSNSPAAPTTVTPAPAARSDAAPGAARHDEPFCAEG